LPRDDQPDTTTAPDIRTSDNPTETGEQATVPYEQYRRLADKNEDLNKNYGHMKKQADEYKKLYNYTRSRLDNYRKESEKKLKRANEVIRVWQEYHDAGAPNRALKRRPDLSEADKLNVQNVEMLDDAVPTTPARLSEALPDGYLDTETHSHGNLPGNPAEKAASEAMPPVLRRRTSAGNPTSNSSSDSARRDAHEPSIFTPRLQHSSSQTTEDDGAARAVTTFTKLTPVRERSSSPIVVSTRVLKRKRPKERRAATVDVVGKVKSENNSSPSLFSFQSQLRLNDSLDLDDLDGNVDTPRKRRNKELRQRLLMSQWPGRSTSVPVECSNAFAAPAPDPRLTSSFDTPKINEKVKLEEAQNIVVHHTEREWETGTSTSAINDRRRMDTRVLQSLDVNNQVLPRTSSSTPKARPKRRKRATSEAIQDVAEDGEPATARSVVSVETATKKKNGPPRIQGLLETPAVVNKHSLLPLSARQSFTTTSARASKLRRVQVDDTEGYGIDDVRPDHEPLRARPINRLRLEDFKVNPRNNQGRDYAFTESVRKKELRHCLPGCTRAECCGDIFRKMTELGGPIVTPNARRALWDSSSQEADDETRLLLAHVGNDASRLARLTLAEKAELLIQARTQELAQTHGKHRQAYARAPSPEGFWRTDMPTTQEAAEDDEKRNAQKRRAVKERYDEAMRPGGQWMFRDEQ